MERQLWSSVEFENGEDSDVATITRGKNKSRARGRGGRGSRGGTERGRGSRRGRRNARGKRVEATGDIEQDGKKDSGVEGDGEKVTGVNSGRGKPRNKRKPRKTTKGDDDGAVKRGNSSRRGKSYGRGRRGGNKVERYSARNEVNGPVLDYSTGIPLFVPSSSGQSVGVGGDTYYGGMNQFTSAAPGGYYSNGVFYPYASPSYEPNPFYSDPPPRNYTPPKIEDAPTQ